MRFKVSLLLLLSVLGLILSASCGKPLYDSAVDEYHDRIVFRFAESLPPEHPSARASQAFADSVFEETGGRIEIRVQYNGEIGSEQEAIEQLRFGGIAFARVSLFTLANEVGGLEPFTEPFAYDTAGDVLTALEKSGDLVGHMLNREQIALLAYLIPDKQCVANARHNVETLADLAGLRISTVSSRAVSQHMARLDAFPVALEGKDVLRSLNSEYIDGALLGLLEYAQGNYSALMPYATFVSAFNSPDVMLAGTVSLGDINNSDKELILRCGQAVFETHRAELEAAQQAALENLVLAGVALYDGVLLETETKQRLGIETPE